MREEALFHRALELPAAERAAFLDRECGGDPALRRHVEALLRAHENPGSFLARPAARTTPTADPAPAADRPPAEGPGGRVGPYTLLREIGAGGMGTVWMAEQAEPVRRTVAVKLVKPGMDSRAVLARFGAERQALALMDHPNIAKVLDAGATEGGRPFFAMELVEGAPITTFCDEHRLTPRQRLELFVPVCQAVQHAHTKGVIHRDIKPSNVLVALYDGTPVPKVIDFGIAKATGPRLTDKTLFTGFGAVVGTPEYMSPEQAELNNADIDTRSDVYSLGVLLYELLTGTTPLDRKRLKETALLEVLRLIREEEPTPPSTRLSGTAELPAIAADRGTEPRKLSRLVRGELDWIAMKCLAKDRDRRYDSAGALAADVQRYLADEPVQAGPPSAWYRLRTFARRNRRALATAAVSGVMLLVAVGAVAGSVGWAARDAEARRAVLEREVTRALEEADAAYRRGDVPGADAAVKRAAGFLAGGGGGEQLRERVRRWETDLRMVARLDQIRMDRSVLRAAEYGWAGAARAYAEAFREYGADLEADDPAGAVAVIAASAVKDALVAGLDDWVLLARVGNVADKDRLLDTARRVDTGPWRDRVLDALRRRDAAALRALARDADLAAQPPATLLLLESVLTETGEAPLAVEVLRRARQQHPGDFWVNMHLGLRLLYLGRPRPAEAVESLRAAAALRPDSPAAHLNLGLALRRAGRPAEAEAEYRLALRLRPDYPVAHTNLSTAARLQGRPDEAERESRAALRLQPGFGTAHVALGLALCDQRRFAEAEAELREALRLAPNSAATHTDLAAIFLRQRKWAEAEAACREAVRLNPDLPEPHRALGTALDGQGKWAAAEAEFRETIRLNPDYPEAHNNLGSALAKQGQWAAAEVEFREAVRLKPDNVLARSNLGMVLLRNTPADVEAARLAAAEAEFRAAVRLDPGSVPAHQGLGEALARSGRWDEAAAAFARAAELTPTDFLSPYLTALLALRADDTEGHRAACRRMVERFGRTDQAAVAAGVARACLLAPDAAGQLEPARRLADRAVTGTAKAPYSGDFFRVKALAEYRAGRYAAATEWAGRAAAKANGTSTDATGFLILALARHRLGRPDDARAALASARAILDRMPDPARGRPFGHNWQEWICCQLLHREAERLLQQTDGEPPTR